jgi:aminopeptidase N
MKWSVLSACLLLCSQLFLPPFALIHPGTLSAESTQIDVVSYRARIALYPLSRCLEGEATVTLCNIMRSDLHEFVLDLRDLTTDRVECDGVALMFSANDTGICIQLDEPLRPLDTMAVTVWYHGIPTSDRDMYSGVKFGPRGAWAHPQSAIERYVAMLPHWLPCNNLFSDKAIFDITFDTPEEWRAAGMGTLTHETVRDGRRFSQWVLRDPLHPAGAGWAAGTYAVYHDTLRGIPFCAYVWPEWERYAKSHFRTIDSMLAVFQHHFGPYPAEKIGYVLTDSSSCEVHTMIILYKKKLGSAYTLEGHELAHHWWGNCVTPLDIRENWLSEGFAMTGEWLITAALSRVRTFDSILRQFTEQYRTVEAPIEGALPLYDFLGAGATYNYASVIYIKGAIVLNMLRHWMGDEPYRLAIRDYFARYRGMNVTSGMFQGVMERHMGVSLEQYFHQWVYSGGWPMLCVRRLAASPHGGLRLGIQQTQEADKGWPLFETPVDIEIVTSAGDTLLLRRMLHALEAEQFVFDEVADSEVLSWRIDPEGWLLHEAQTVTATAAVAALPSQPRLEAPYPQPLAKGSVVAFVPMTVPAAGSVTVELRDMLGRRMRTVADGFFEAGRHVLPVDLQGCAAGQYHVLLRSAAGSDAHIVVVY